MPGPDFSLPVVGERYDNEDGTSRQQEIRKLQPGDPVELVREKANPFDPSAVAVISERGVRVGYIGADRSAWIGSKIDKAMPIIAVVEAVKGSRRGTLPCKLIIRINLYGDVPKVA